MKRAVAALIGLIGCSPTPPTISIVVVEGPGAPRVQELDRLQLILQTCDADAPLVDRAIATDRPTTEQALMLVPGTKTYVHLKGWQDCAPAEVCTQPAEASVSCP